MVAVQSVEDGGDAAQPVHVGANVAADLQLPPGVAVGRRDILQRLRQAVAHGIVRVGGGDRVHEAHRVARVDAVRRGRRGQQRRRVEAHELGREARRREAHRVAPQRLAEGQPVQPQPRVEPGAVHQRLAEGGDERVQPLRRAGSGMGRGAFGVVAERRRGPARQRRLRRQLHGAAELVLIVGVGQRRVLVEPLGGESFRGHPLRLAPVLAADPRAQHGLRAVADGDDAEAEGQAEAEIPLEGVERGEAVSHRPSVSCRPRRWPMAKAAAVGPSGT